MKSEKNSSLKRCRRQFKRNVFLNVMVLWLNRDYYNLNALFINYSKAKETVSFEDRK